MSVFLRLGNAELGKSLVLEIFAKVVGNALGRVSHLDIETFLVAGHGGVGGAELFVTREPIKGVIREGMGQLSGPVGTEVVEDYGVIFLHTGVVADDCRKDKLIGNIFGVAVSEALSSGGSLFSAGVGDGFVGLGYSVPALVSVHGVVAATDSGDSAAEFSAFFFKSSKVFVSTLGGDVTAVQEAVDEDPVGRKALVGGQLQQSI